MLTLFFKLYFILPLMLFILTIGLAVRSSRRLKYYIEDVAVIVGFRTKYGEVYDHFDNLHRDVLPILKYTVNGQEYECLGHCLSTGMKVGDEVKIMYSQDDCENISMKLGLYIAPMITGVLTVFATVALIVFVVLRSKGILIF